jgi:hypothetical protein
MTPEALLPLRRAAKAVLADGYNFRRLINGPAFYRSNLPLANPGLRFIPA